MRYSLFEAPSIIVAGHRCDTLGTPVAAAVDALGAEVRVTHVPAKHGARGWLPLLRRAAPLLRGGAEALHLFDPSLAPAALLLRSRYGVPVTATVPGNPALLPRWQIAALRRLDELIVHGVDASGWNGIAAAVSAAPPVAADLAASPVGESDSVGRLLAGLPPARLIVGVPWTRDGARMRWFRDAVAPILAGDPLCLVLGAPGRRQARLFAGAIGLHARFRLHTGRLDAGLVAAASRYVDAFLLLDEPRTPVDAQDLALALAAAGAPVVAAAGLADAVLEHERNAIVTDGSNGMALAAALNQVLALPAIQRHYLGADFRGYTLDRLPWSCAAGVYARRFAALVGRPQVPAELRAA